MFPNSLVETEESLLTKQTNKCIGSYINHVENKNIDINDTFIQDYCDEKLSHIIGE